MNTEQLNIYPDTNRTTSRAVVTITQPGSILRGRGLEADLATKRYELQSEVRSPLCADPPISCCWPSPWPRASLARRSRARPTATRRWTSRPATSRARSTIAQPSILSGGVHITQGSLDINRSQAEISFADGDPSRAVFTGGPVVLKQQMDDGTPMNARANNVDYNLKTETVVFTGDVQIQQPRGSMSGQRMVYNLKTGNIDSGGEGNGRVKMRILPRNAQPAAPSRATPAQDAQRQARTDAGRAKACASATARAKSSTISA